MKKYSFILLSFVFISVFSSCNDEFMQRDPIDDMADGTFFVKEADLPLYLDGLYRYYIYGHGIGGTNNTSHDKGFLAVKAGSQIIFGDAFSDNAVYAGTSPDTKLQGTYDAPNTASKNFDNPWNWKKLRKVNYFLNHYKEVGDPELLKGYAAEAYFFKAWDYYIKLLALGEVPWIDKELDTESEEMYGPRTPRKEIVENILECLDFAIANLDDNENSCGRINKDMAGFLKARFCLFEGTFRKYHKLGLEYDDLFRQSRDAAKAIIDKGKYELYRNPAVKDSYWQLFVQKGAPEAENNNETILARVYDGVKLGNDNPRYWGFNNHTRYCMGATTAMLEDYLCEDGKPVYTGGSPGNYEKNPLFKGYDGMWEELDNRDPRLRQTVCKPGEYASIFDYANGTYGLEQTGIIYPMVTYATGGGSPVKMYNSTVTGYRFIKHWMPDKANWEANPNGVQTAHMFRYGELLLIYAEAKAELNELTNEDLAITVNKLRERAGYDFSKYPNARLTLSNIPDDPRLDAIYAEKLDYSVSPVLREIRRERRVEMMMEGMRYEDLIRWKAGKLFTVPARGMKMTEEKIALYDNRIDKVNPATGIKETAVPKIQIGNDVIVDNERFIIPYPMSPTIINGVHPWNDKRYYYPIPLNELLLNPNLTQNPGWKDINR
ncbi:MAG: RagB/SusD family nutrient uptake outer membrane protein [Tannerella sp.]|jgi:hypothetical protein|nr:RagB/SusD family nutrient uptake outer membrane protein [Tannerella sp.]